MSMFVHEKVVIKTTELPPTTVSDSVYDVLEEEGFIENIDLTLTGNTVEFVIYADVNASFDIQDLLEKIHKCNTNIQAVCSIDMDSNVGFYTATASNDSLPSVVYGIFSKFIGEVRKNLDDTLKDAASYLFRGQEKQ